MQHAFSWEPAVSHGAPSDIRSAIRRASAESGVSFSYLMEKAAVESGFRTDAKARTSSATGLFQFIESTWLDMVRDHGAKFGLGKEAAALASGGADAATRREILALREDPVIAARMAAQYARNNEEHLKRTVGGPVGETELYLAHFLGPGGAEKFLRAMRADPERAARDVLPSAAGANRPIFYDGGRPRSLEQVYEHFAAKFGGGKSGETLVAETRPAAPPWSGYTYAPVAAKAGLAAVPRPLPGQVPMMLTPSTYAARLFMAGMSFPGESRLRV